MRLKPRNALNLALVAMLLATLTSCDERKKSSPIESEHPTADEIREHIQGTWTTADPEPITLKFMTDTENKTTMKINGQNLVSDGWCEATYERLDDRATYFVLDKRLWLPFAKEANDIKVLEISEDTLRVEIKRREYVACTFKRLVE